MSESPIIAIANADIYMNMPDSVRELISLLQPGEAIVGRRTNIHSLQEKRASIYRLGFDLFIIHSSDIDKLLRHSNNLYFGDPWWDYDLLTNLIASGIQIRPLKPIHVLHLSHQHAFSKDRWADIGFNSIQDMRNLINQIPHSRMSQEGLTLSKLIERVHSQIINFFTTQDACNSGSAFQLSSDEHHVKPLREFAHGLIDLGENVLGLQNEFDDSSDITTACSLLLDRLCNSLSSH
ncbi:hypothetical protein [Cyanobium sp. CH-040]|uniref:hypothetical protein n=1 Tax=Cyanobium sp. CH-040 TaxID=2823708 RepID=UPI0020CC80FA|nr:hypothetical protein [Cyanobium sp. CH-040]MCP9926733.1 hypothetical protein [Cyanobium sp. CH-040]